jgi:DHA2 family multidrug resistance protein
LRPFYSHFAASDADAEAAALATLAKSVRREAMVMAFSDVFLALAVVYFLVLSALPLTRKPQPLAAGIGAGH